MQVTLRTFVLALPAILAIHTAAAAIPQVQRDQQDDYQEDSPEAIQAMWSMVERRGDAPPPACNMRKRLVFGGGKTTDSRQIDQGCYNTGTKTTDTSIDASKTDGSTDATNSGNDGGSGGNDMATKGDTDTSNQGKISACRRSVAHFGLGRRHAFGRRNEASGKAREERKKAKAAAKAQQEGNNVQGDGNTITKDSSHHVDKSDHSDHSDHSNTNNSNNSDNRTNQSFQGNVQGGITGNNNGNQCNYRRDNEEFEGLEARMENTGTLVLRAIGGTSRRHEDSPLELLARRDMAMVAQALGVRANLYDNGSVNRRDSKPQLVCDYEECGESERREAVAFLRAHARDLGFEA